MAPARKKLRLSNGNAAVVTAEDGVDAPDTRQTNGDSKQDQQRRSLFVRSLPPTATSESLTELFSESYPVKHATAVIDPATKQCRGYGFITFADAEDAQRARTEFNGYTLEGRKLRVELAERRQREDKGQKEEDLQPPAPRQRKEIPQPSRLIVRNLPWTVKTSDDLAKLFMSYGKVKQAYIPKKRDGLLAGFGFVVLRGRKNAEKAVEGVNGKEVEGRTLAVDWAVSKEVYEDLLKKSEEGDVAGAEDMDVDERNDGLDGNLGMVEADTDEPDDDSDGDANNDEDEDLDSIDIDIEEEDDNDASAERSEDRSTTVFVRNLPFTCTDEDLEDHFSTFGRTRYARVVMDAATERSKGTGFVCFHNKEDADGCIRAAPKRTMLASTSDSKDAKATKAPNSILQNEESDPSGRYTMDGRVLQVSPAINKSDADRLTREGAAHRRKSKEDKRHLYLLSEGTISTRSKLYDMLSPSERNMRENSAKQRKALIESNPSLHLSLTRLSIRNIPRSVGSKELKALARDAVVGFATDVKTGSRERLSKEELARGGEEMQEAEKTRKKGGKGVVKQAKVVFEGAGGSKVSEDTGAGRSRGYGFIEYYTHRNALMGLRWLNGHAIGYQVKDNTKTKVATEDLQDRKKRLIVEFAIENAQVVMRRKDSEQKARDRSLAVQRGEIATEREKAIEAFGNSRRGSLQRTGHGRSPATRSGNKKVGLEKTSASGDNDRSRSGRFGSQKSPTSGGRNGRPFGKPVTSTASADNKATSREKKPVDEKLAQRNRIIGRKRAMRRARKT